MLCPSEKNAKFLVDVFSAVLFCSFMLISLYTNSITIVKRRQEAKESENQT